MGSLCCCGGNKEDSPPPERQQHSTGKKQSKLSPQSNDVQRSNIQTTKLLTNNTTLNIEQQQISQNRPSLYPKQQQNGSPHKQKYSDQQKTNITPPRQQLHRSSQQTTTPTVKHSSQQTLTPPPTHYVRSDMLPQQQPYHQPYPHPYQQPYAHHSPYAHPYQNPYQSPLAHGYHPSMNYPNMAYQRNQHPVSSVAQTAGQFAPAVNALATNYAYSQPHSPTYTNVPPNTVIQPDGFDAGSRFDMAISPASIPPPPPGHSPNAVQLAAAKGQNTMVGKKKESWFTGGSGGGFTGY